MAKELKPSLQPRANLKTQLIARLRFSNILKLPEADFARLISDIESDPIFQKLVFPEDQGLKAVLRRRFPRTRITSSFYEIKEDLKGGGPGVDVESILSKHAGIVELIRKIGQPQFERYFLYRDGSESIDSIAENCALAAEEVLKVQALVTELSVHSEFFHPSTLSPENGLHYTPIGRIEFDENSEAVLSFFSPHLAGGRYVINQDRVESIRRRLNTDDRKALTNLVHRIELANLRYDTMNKILRELVARQEPYLRSREPNKLAPFSQREMADRVEVAPSTVCRAIFGKSVVMPWGEEVPLKDLFPARKQAAERWIADLLSQLSEAELKNMTDNDLKELLAERYRLKVSRRSVNLYRRAVQKDRP